MPPHKLKLKPGAIIMLLRNLAPSKGFLNDIFSSKVMMLLQKFWNNLHKDETTDLELVVKSEENIVSFSCHNRVISGISDIFKEICSFEKNGRIAITNVKPNIMFLILCYIYDGNFNSSNWETTVDLFIAASTYNFTSLYQMCIESLINALDFSNASSILELALEYTIPDLYTKSLQICLDPMYFRESEDFYWASPSTIVTLITHPFLKIPNEGEFVHALWMRATVESCRKDIDVTYDNIVAIFSQYFLSIKCANVKEQDIKAFKNEYMTKYFESKLN